MASPPCSCSYCVAATLRQRGDVYCATSLQPEIAELDTGIFGISEPIASNDHVSRLSIRLVRGGRQYYRLGGSQHHMIDHDALLVINHGQTYATDFSGRGTMYGLALRPSLATDVLYCADRHDALLLDTPRPSLVPILALGDRTFDIDGPMRGITDRVWEMMVRPHPPSANEIQATAVAALETLLHLQESMLHRADRLAALRPSTRQELLRRCLLGRDYLTAWSHTPVSMREAAREACLSEYHFIRSFGDLFGETPFTWLSRQRIRHACMLLVTTSMAVAAVGRTVGFENPSSFVRRFRALVGCTPGTYRDSRTPRHHVLPPAA